MYIYTSKRGFGNRPRSGRYYGTHWAHCFIIYQIISSLCLLGGPSPSFLIGLDVSTQLESCVRILLYMFSRSRSNKQSNHRIQ